VAERTSLRVHEDPDLFVAALRFTAAQTGFPARLIEKDYFCSVVLEHLATLDRLVFKGGTCLAKVHAAFYRLSEDLDYAIPMPLAATRQQRSAETAALKRSLAALPDRRPALRLVEPLTGANESTQYLGRFGYTSLLSKRDESIAVEISLREPLVEAATVATAATVLQDPVTGAPMAPPLPVACISLREAYAEKLRAALTRRDVAIRDFFDLDYAVREIGLDPGSPEMLTILRAKLAIPGNPGVDVSAERLGALRRQLEPRLRPVLRSPDFEAFDLERAITIVIDVARLVMNR
jgi:predicted nucleotidyltransferase component of viral defense system